MTAVKRSWTMSSACDHEIGSQPPPPPALPPGARPAQRRLETSLAVHETRIRLRNLRAEDASRIGIRARAPDRDDPLVLHRDGEAAGVGTIEGANARVLSFHGLSPVIPVY